MNIQTSVLHWLANGEVGASSKTMALRAADIPNRDEWEPSDPDDLRRCLLLLEAIPAVRLHFGAIAQASPIWAEMIDRWDELEALFLEECGSLRPSRWTSAPRLYAVMRGIYDRHPDPRIVMTFGERGA